MLFAPRKTPPEVLARLNRVVDAALEEPQFVSQMASQGIVIVGGSADQAKTFLASEIDRWGKLIRTRGLKAE